MRIKKGDRMRIEMSAINSFGAGGAEGIVLKADHWHGGAGWYVELEKDKDKVWGRGWQKGYGYWKQGSDGGTVTRMLCITPEEGKAIDFVAGRYSWSAYLQGHGFDEPLLLDDETRTELVAAFEEDDALFPMLSEGSTLYSPSCRG